MKRLYKLILLLCAFSTASNTNAKVSISEFMPCNASTFFDSQYYFYPYIEFKSDSKVDLKGATIIQYKGKKEAWRRTLENSHIIQPGFSILFFGGDKETSSKDGVYLGYVPEKLEYKAGSIEIVGADGKVITSLTYPQQYPDLAYSDSGYVVPTPLDENGVACKNLSERVPKPTFATKPGIYSDLDSMRVTINVPEGAKVIYTRDGSEPLTTNPKKKEYSGPIKIGRSRPIRARAYIDGKVYSEELVGSFMLKNEKYNKCSGDPLPIVHLITDTLLLFGDEYGIATKGKNGITGTGCNDVKANYNRDWSRPVIFEYIDTTGELLNSQLVEASVFGGCSRKYDVKSLKLKATKKTGNNRYNYNQFFKEKDIPELKSVQLRNGGNGYEGVICRDGFMQTLCQGLGIDYQAYQPVAYYVNGEYKRLMGLRERTNEDYAFHNYGLEEDDIEHLEIGNEKISPNVGTLEWYNSMITYVENHYNDADFYDRLGEYMDIDEYLNWVIFEQYIVNTDWPSNNTKIWRKKRDGKLRWILYDTDFGFGIYGGGGNNYTDYYTDMIKFCTGEGSNVNWGNGKDMGWGYEINDESAWKITLFKHCIKNPDFKRQYIKRYRKIVSETFKPERVAAVWDSIASMVKQDYCASRETSISYARDGIMSFANNRPEYALKYLREYFGMQEGKVTLTFKMESDVTVKDFAFLFCKDRIEKTSYKYEALKGQSVKIEPLVPKGYKIDGWKVSEEVSKVTKLITSSTPWKYYYKSAEPVGDWKVAGYDEKGWREGTGSIGFGNTATIDTKIIQDTFMTAYFRRSFTLDAVPEVVNFKLKFDDGYVLYVNGTEVKRGNLPKGEITYDTQALQYVNDTSTTIDLAGDLFKVGENVIAVEIHQVEPNSSDILFAGTANMTSIVGNSNDKFFEGDITKDMTVTVRISEDKDYKTPKLYINEVCSSNNEYEDDWGAKPDWIEIYNAEDSPVDLGGMTIKNITKGLSFTVPTGRAKAVVPAKGHIVVFASKNKEKDDSPIHTGFQLNAANSETVGIYQKVRGVEVMIDTMRYLPHLKNGSYGRNTDGGSLMAVFNNCTESSHLNKIMASPNAKNGALCTKMDTDEITVEQTRKGFSIYPNPAKSVLFLSLLNDELTADWSVIDLSGKVVMTGIVVDGKTVVETETLPDGVYAIRVVTADDVYTELFIKR